MRRPLLGLFAAGLLLSAGGPAAAADRVLQVVAPWDVGSLEPSRAGYVFTRLEVAETLVGARPDGTLLPALARHWSASDDALSWRFVLRDARFHDGTPVTAAVVIQALTRARAQPGPLGTVPLTGIEADGADAVIIRLSTPFAALPAFLAHYSTQVLAPASYDAAGATQFVIGSGAYRVTGLGLPLRVDLTRNEAWSGGPVPAITRVSYLGTARAEARALMADSGQADLAFTLDPPSMARLRRNAAVQVEATPIPRVELLKLNAGSPLFADARVRRAVSLGLDRAGIARAILGNPGAAATQMFPPSLAEWHVPALPPLGRDKAEAARLLAAAGWLPGPDGVLRKDGRPFRATLRTYADRPELPVVAAAIQDQLRGLGLDIAVSVVNSSEVPAGHKDGTLDMALIARNFGLVPDPLGTVLQDYSAPGGDWGTMGWSDAGMQAALDGLRGETRPEARAGLRAAVATILQRDLPVIPVAWYDHTLASSKRLSHVVLDPFELSYNISAMRWAP
ncbi:MAG: ABC transporter substrate-binding protein [Janthinobacterium lividum]